MGRITHDHFCLLILGQGIWKETFIKKISKDTKSSFFHLAGYSKDSLFCTCPICNSLVKLFDPQHPGDYVGTCELCKPLFEIFKTIQGINEGIIMFSHQLIYDINQKQILAQNLLSNENIKKIFILEFEHVKISKPISLIIEELSHKRLTQSEFLKLKQKEFEYRRIYEIFKDKYY